MKIVKMKQVNLRHLPTKAEEDTELRIIEELYRKGGLYALRIGRALAYGIGAYLLLSLQQHFSFSHAWMSVAISTLALARRSLFISEIALAIIAVSVFVPVGILQTLIGMI